MQWLANSKWDGFALFLLLALAATVGYKSWLKAHPWHDPRAPFDLRQPEGWATSTKLATIRRDTGECRATLARSEIEFVSLAPVGEDACRREDRVEPIDPVVPFAPSRPDATCSVHAGMDWWMRHRVQPAAQRHLDAEVTAVEHYGTVSCRRVNGARTGRWSEHATGNAIDIASFRLSDGRRVSVLGDWNGDDPSARFLKEARDGACDAFGTVLSPDYNAAHADHLHLDQAARGFGSFCR